MFDRLVESSSTGAELRPRRRIFAATLAIVTTLFATAVVASLYAADLDLGASNFDIAELLTPGVETVPTREPEPPRLERNSNLPQSTNHAIVRQILMESTAESTKVPDKISTDVNPYASADISRYRDVKIGKFDLDPSSQGVGPTGSTDESGFRPDAAGADETNEPPPAPPRIGIPKRPVSIGVANGIAISLPRPPYPPAAIAVHAKGAVNVQVVIDEHGKVISAKAASGHILLRQVAEQAAWKARFTPTKLSNVPVKVTGVIVYNFTR